MKMSALISKVFPLYAENKHMPFMCCSMQDARKAGIISAEQELSFVSFIKGEIKQQSTLFGYLRNEGVLWLDQKKTFKIYGKPAHKRSRKRYTEIQMCQQFYFFLIFDLTRKGL